MSVLDFHLGSSVPSPRMFSLPPNLHRLHRAGLILYFGSKTSESSLGFLFSRTPLRHTKRKLTGFLPSCCVFFLTIKGFIRSSVLRRSRTTAQQAPRQVAVLGCAATPRRPDFHSTGSTRRLMTRLLLKTLAVGFPGGLMVKNPSTNSGDTDSIPDLRRSPVPQLLSLCSGALAAHQERLPQ